MLPSFLNRPTYILHLFHLEDTALLFLFLSESVKVRFLPHVDTFSFAQRVQTNAEVAKILLDM
jgi:hypothetical protein